MKFEKVRERLKSRNDKSARDRGVTLYALEMLDDIEERTNDIELNSDNLLSIALNGASDWREYSYGACSLIYDEDIAKRLCTPSELKRKDNGRLPPRRGEMWLDAQAVALKQAFRRLRYTMKAVKEV